MVAGHLQEKKGYYYAVLSYRNTDGRRKTKWLSTGLPVKGNKKRAEAFLMEQRQHFVIPAADAPADPSRDELFAEYLQRWLQIARTTIAVTTYGSYSGLLSAQLRGQDRSDPGESGGQGGQAAQDRLSGELLRT